MNRYNAKISAGSLLPLESRRIAQLLLVSPDAAAWLHAIETENLLQKKPLLPHAGKPPFYAGD